MEVRQDGCLVFLMIRRHPSSTRADTLFPYTTRCLSARWFALADIDVSGAVAAIRFPHQPAWIAAQRLDGRIVLRLLVIVKDQPARHRFPAILRLDRPIG